MGKIATPADIIAAINPEMYSKSPSELKALTKSKGIDAAVAKVADEGWAKSLMDYKLTYNTTSEILEPVYFWILDFLGGPEKVEKLVDNFQSTPGSARFSEFVGKATKMQEEGMKVMQTVGILIKSLINIIYDLRQFEIRINDYKQANSKDKNKAEAGLLSLKQIWLDNVDIKRGNTSIKAMAFSQASFATLIDGFMIANSISDVKKMDLNDRVKRILEQRMLEFEKWRELSEKELTKRYQIQKTWLKSQVESLKLYSRWAKPYLKMAEELNMTGDKSAALVKAFNTVNIQLTLFKKDKINIKEEALARNLPSEFENINFKRNYYKCMLLDFNFRGVPMGQQFGGKVEVTFRTYVLNKDEIDLFDALLEDSDLGSALSLVEGATGETLKELSEDIEYFLKDEDERLAEEAGEIVEQDVNPFLALFGFGTRKEKKLVEKARGGGGEKKKRIEILKKKGVSPDNYAESVVREFAEKGAIEDCYKVYDVYKKSHGMASASLEGFVNPPPK